MNEHSADSIQRDAKLQDILHGYLQAMDTGQAPGRAELLRRHTEFASELEAFLSVKRTRLTLIPPGNV